MSFSSFTFIFEFLPLTLFGFYLFTSRKSQLLFLLAASIIFYCHWNAKFSLLMLFTVGLDFYLASAISRAANKTTKRNLLVLSAITNLGVLGFFKYYGFFSENINYIANVSLLPIISVVLPIGISFYTFQSLSYVIDVYRGKAKAHRELLSFASYVTMFPHLISGPLVRHDSIVPQLENPKNYRFRMSSLWLGMFFFVIGLAKKILIADRLAVVVTPIVASIEDASKLEAILAMLGYTMQLYFDFSGYSDMAIGLALLLNIQFPQNFNSPYKAVSITDFWRRWHMTLSSWLRDYLYISLGGNRKGPARTYVNLMITMALGGLWHGASWNFLVWGLLHGTVLCGERFVLGEKVRTKYLRPVSWAFTFLVVNIGWVFFRAPDIKSALAWLERIFVSTSGRMWDVAAIAPSNKDRFVAVLIISLVGAFFGKNTFEMNMKPSIKNSIWLGVLFFLSLMFLHEESPFLYFQF